MPLKFPHTAELVTMTAVTALLCVFGLGALLIGRVSAGEQCNSCQVSYCNVRKVLYRKVTKSWICAMNVFT